MTDERRDLFDLPEEQGPVDPPATGSAATGSSQPGAGAAPVDAPEVGAGALARQHPVFVYTMLRIAMLVAVGAVLYLFSVRGVWLILFAFLVSGVLSAVVLRRPREGAVLGFTSAYRDINSRLDERSRAEDRDDDLDEAPPASS